MKPKYWLVLSAAAACGVPVAACTSDFSSCSASRTCPPLGSGGMAEAGEGGADAGNASSNAGAGGQAPAGGATNHAGGPSADAGAPSADAGAGGEAPAIVKQCVKDADCSDHLVCNGVETCQDGVCKAGPAPCANPDAVHCDAVCDEAAGAASCSVRGKDADKDGHFSSACLAKPGDDCDDSAPTVYTGAPELCDGLDNNCNKKVDLSDGLTAGGNTIAIGPSGAARSFPSIAWATDKSVFGIAYRDTSSSPTANLYFEEVGNAGTVVLEPEELNDAATRGISGPDLAWGGGSFGVAWTADTQGAYLRTFGSNGTLTMAAHHLELSKAPVGFTAGALYSPAVARTSNGDWEVMYYATYDTEGSGYVSGHTITSSGVVGTAVGVPYSSYAVPSLSLAAVGANFVTSITDGSGSAALRNSAFSSIKSLTVQGSVGSGGNGFAMADRAASGAELPKFYAFTSDGTVQCGPVPFADKSFKPEDIVATANGYLVVSSGAVRVQEVFADCSLGALFTVDPGPASNVRIAGGSAGYGLVWQDSAANIPKRRLLGPRYCD